MHRPLGGSAAAGAAVLVVRCGARLRQCGDHAQHGRLDMDVRGGSLILLVGPGTVVDADSLTVRHTYVAVGPSAEPGAPVVFRVQLAGRMCYGQIEARWSSF